MKNLFFGGPIITLSEPLYADAMLTDGGRVLALGSLDALRAAAPGARETDLCGRTLAPAFIDAHSHFTQMANSLLQVSVDDADSVEKLRARIAGFIEETALRPGEWVTARDYDNNLFPGARHPALGELDSLASGYRLTLQHKSGHMGLFNSAALAALGLTPDTPDPEGGAIGRKDGALTGYMEENAFFSYLKKIPMPGIDALMGAYGRAQDIYAAHGITTMQEGMLVKEMLPLYAELLRRDILKLDLVVYPCPDCLDAARRLVAASGSKRCRVGGIKIFLDGSPQGRTAWMRSPYLGGDGGYCGYSTMTDEQVLDAFRLAAREKTQLLAHCNGDAAAAQFLRCLALAEREHPVLRTLRPVIIHGQLLGLDQLETAARLGATVSFFVAHVYHWGEVHIKNFGLDRASEISPAASAKRAGLPFTFHQDAPVIQPDMLETVWCAVNRRTAGGTTLGEGEKLSALEALEAVTLSAARQYGEEASKGSLAPGKLADYIILDRDPLAVGADKLRDIRVLRSCKEDTPVFTARDL